MWKAGGRAAAEIQSQRRRAHLRTFPVHIKRVKASLLVGGPSGATVLARVVLNDLSATGIEAFASQFLFPDQDVILTIEGSQVLKVRGRVSWCMELPSVGRVLSASASPYRAGIHFVFTDEQERAAFARACEEIHREELSAIATA